MQNHPWSEHVNDKACQALAFLWRHYGVRASRSTTDGLVVADYTMNVVRRAMMYFSRNETIAQVGCQILAVVRTLQLASWQDKVRSVVCAASDKFPPQQLVAAQRPTFADKRHGKPPPPLSLWTFGYHHHQVAFPRLWRNQW